MIIIKSQTDIKAIRQAAEIWKQTRLYIESIIAVGMSLKKLEKKVARFVKSQQAACSFYKCYDFPSHLCISINDQLIHGICDDYELQENDLVKIDLGITYDNHVCDAAFMVIMPPQTNEAALKIKAAAEKALADAIAVVKPGNFIGDIEAATEASAKASGFEVIKDFGGHGCGNKLHEDPVILNYGKKQTKAKLVPNMTLCIEPMLLTGSDDYYINANNGWTVISQNHQLTAHCEHMVLVTKDGCEILTEIERKTN